MSGSDFDCFANLLRSLAATSNPPAPRNAGEHFLAVAAAAYAGWIERSARVERTAPLGEHIALRQRLRAVEAENEQLRAGAPAVQPLPPRSAHRRPHNQPR